MAINKTTVTNAIDSALTQITTAETEIKAFAALSASAGARTLVPLENLRRAREALGAARVDFVGAGAHDFANVTNV